VKTKDEVRDLIERIADLRGEGCFPEWMSRIADYLAPDGDDHPPEFAIKADLVSMIEQLVDYAKCEVSYRIETDTRWEMLLSDHKERITELEALLAHEKEHVALEELSSANAWKKYAYAEADTDNLRGEVRELRAKCQEYQSRIAQMSEGCGGIPSHELEEENVKLRTKRDYWKRRVDQSEDALDEQTKLAVDWHHKYDVAQARIAQLSTLCQEYDDRIERLLDDEGIADAAACGAKRWRERYESERKKVLWQTDCLCKANERACKAESDYKAMRVEWQARLERMQKENRALEAKVTLLADQCQAGAVNSVDLARTAGEQIERLTASIQVKDDLIRALWAEKQLTKDVLAETWDINSHLVEELRDIKSHALDT
jgi:uncharacterized coiled-coil DUF342 family protein